MFSKTQEKKDQCLQQIEDLSKKDINRFLFEMGELYHDAPLTSLTYQEIEKKTFTELLKLKCKGVDLKFAINKPCYQNGESELMSVFRWADTVDVMIPWFLMLVKFGGNPLQKNKNGHDSYDIAMEVFKKQGIEEEFSDFVKDVEAAQKTF